MSTRQVRGLLLGLSIFFAGWIIYAGDDSINLLFVGNSYCDFNVLPNQVVALLAESGQSANAKRETKGGFSWRQHWDVGKAQERIRDEGYDIVVLQNHSKSSLLGRGNFDIYGQKYIEWIKDAGARPILYMTWARADSPDDQGSISEAYCTLAVKNEISVAPVGEAFKAFIKKYPEIKLHAPDKSHPSMVGSYLAACVFYSTITGKSPLGLSGSIDGFNWITKGNKLADLDSETAAKAQTVAWETVNSFKPAEFADPEHKMPEPEMATGKIAENTTGVGIDDRAIKVNFGGKTDAAGWNNISGAKAAACPLVDSLGRPTSVSLEMYDPFQDYANPNVINGELSGDMAVFQPSADATLFTHREENPTGAFKLSLDPGKTYTVKLWASRTGTGMRWAKYVIKGAEETFQFMAAGANRPKGNHSQVLTFGGVAPAGNGDLVIAVKFPESGEKVNYGKFVYLTGMIIQPE